MRKIKILLLTLLIFETTKITAQTLEPFFETTLYFEDAVGNMDSVIFGYDINATQDIDPEFGEVELTTPFDSIFEVRIGSSDFPSQKLSKRLIYNTEAYINDTTCYGGSLTNVYIHAIHQPVKVWWDKEQFLEDICFRGGFVINHTFYEVADPLIPPNEFPPIFYCMAAVDSGYFEVTHEAFDGVFPYGPRVKIDKEIEGQGIQTIYGLRYEVTPRWGYTPCYWVVSDILEPEDIQKPLQVSPNPATTYVKPGVPEDVRILKAVIYNCAGEQVWMSTSDSIEQMDVSGLNNGLYYLLVYGAEKEVFIGKFVKT